MEPINQENIEIDQENISEEENLESGDMVKLKGKFIESIGKRKKAIARVRIYKNGTGAIIINDGLKNYFSLEQAGIARQPLKLSGHLKDLNISIKVSGGGKKSQAEAIRHAITLGLIEIDNELKPLFKAKGWITRDARKKERKKPGLKKARKAPQWAKR